MIDRSHIEREIEIVCQQGREAQAMVQQAASVVQQAIGAEKALRSVLKQIDEASAMKVEDETAAAEKAKEDTK